MATGVLGEENKSMVLVNVLLRAGEALYRQQISQALELRTRD
jgi:hypothetical protein